MTSSSDLKEARAAVRERFMEHACRGRFSQSRSVSRQPGNAARVATRTNILGSGLGSKISGGRFSGERAVIVYVRKKLPRDELPRRLRIPKSISGVPVDVIETGLIRALAAPPAACIVNPRARHARPFPAGVSIGGGDNAAGTFGYLVRVTGQSGDFILSNYHVLGDLAGNSQNLPVYQPGSGDGVLHPTRVVGRFFGGTPIDFSGAPNRLDAAIAKAKPGSAVASLCRIGSVSGVAQSLNDDDIVSIYGKTSGFSKGAVADTDVEVVIRYPGNREALFINQITIRSLLPGRGFSQHGDSGALVVNKDQQAYALLFAGTPELSWATPISTVVQELGISFPE